MSDSLLNRRINIMGVDSLDVNLTDSELIQGLSAGDLRIFDYIFLTYYSGLVVFARKLGVPCGNDEDIVQELFIRLWNTRQNIRITSSLKSYLFTAVANKAKNYLRHESVKRNSSEAIKIKYYPEYSEKDFIVEKELRAEINKAIEELPDKCRKIFIMNKIEGMTTEKIAELENISVRTVEGHIGKAYKIMREKLKDTLPASLVMTVLYNMSKFSDIL